MNPIPLVEVEQNEARAAAWCFAPPRLTPLFPSYFAELIQFASRAALQFIAVAAQGKFQFLSPRSAFSLVAKVI